MAAKRRTFLKGLLVAAGLTTGAGGLWVGTSERRTARWLRVMLADTQRRVPPAPLRPDPAAWSDNAITMAWLGHASVLINFYGLNILTDPVFGSRVGVDLGLGTAGPKRYVASALQYRDLPPIDVLLLSHAHMDHMDLPSLSLFPAHTFTLTAKATHEIVNRPGRHEVHELAWGERIRYRSAAKGDLEIKAFEVRHWGRRWPNDIDRGYNAYVLRREGKALIFGGDTAHTPLFREVRPMGPFETAIMPIGAYNPWIRSHCTPEEAWEMANDAGARYVVPIHHSTFRLSDEPMDEPIARLEEAMQWEPERLALRRVGETFSCRL